MKVITKGKKKTRFYTTTEKGLDFIESLKETMTIFMAPLILEVITVQEIPGVSIAKGG